MGKEMAETLISCSGEANRRLARYSAAHSSEVWAHKCVNRPKDLWQCDKCTVTVTIFFSTVTRLDRTFRAAGG
jgi:hypothetical protein